MLKYPLSFVVYITLSFLIGCLLFFTVRLDNINNIFIVAAFILLSISSILLIDNKNRHKNNLAFILAIISIFFISYVYSSYRYKNIEQRIDYNTNVEAFTAKVIGYDGEFEYKYGVRERYICEVNSIYTGTNFGKTNGLPATGVETSTSSYTHDFLSFAKTYFRIRLYNSSKKEIKINDELIVNSKINFYKNILTNESDEYDNEAIVNALENKMLLGVSSIYRSEKFVIEKRFFNIQNFLNIYAKKIRSFINISLNNLDKNNKAIILSIVLGDKRELTSRTRELFSNVGLSHILAVSGLHLSIVVLVFNLLLFFIVRRKTIRYSLAIIIAIIIFVPITLFSVSVVRASIMYFLIFLTLIFGKRLNSLHNLFLACLIILIQNPITVLDMSFQFSFLATFGIVTFFSVYDNIKKTKIVRAFTNVFIISISAIIMILPISIYNFNLLNLNSLISNVYASFFAFVIILLTLINVMLFFLFPSLAFYSSLLLDKTVSLFVLIASGQESLNILKWGVSINISTALFFTAILFTFALVLKYRHEKNIVKVE